MSFWRANKYRAVKTTQNGIIFDSKFEAKRHAQLQLQERVGQISGLRRQPKFDLWVTREDGEQLKLCRYRGDFFYKQHDSFICEDSKGFETPVFKLKWKLAKFLFPEINFITTREKGNG